MSDRYARILKMVSEYPWAILPATLDVIVEILTLRAEGSMFTDAEIKARLGAAGPPRPPARSIQHIAVLPLFGVIAPRMNVMTQISGGTSADAFGAMFQRVIDNPEVTAVVLDVDSPGGSVFGIEELADQIHAARGSKPIVAVANHTAASAAYWLASQADEIIASPSSMLGSIGVIAAHQDLSAADAKAGVKTTFISAGRYKAEAAPGEPLSEEARAAIQGHVDEFYRVFVQAVARGRDVKVQAVRDGFGEGRIVSAREAVSLGMADGLATLDQVVEQLASGSKRVAGALARAAVPIAAAAAPGAPAPALPIPVEPYTDEVSALRSKLAERGA
jgi:signal peptide peptidase SppA